MNEALFFHKIKSVLLYLPQTNTQTETAGWREKVVFKMFFCVGYALRILSQKEFVLLRNCTQKN